MVFRKDVKFTVFMKDIKVMLLDITSMSCFSFKNDNINNKTIGLVDGTIKKMDWKSVRGYLAVVKDRNLFNFSSSLHSRLSFCVGRH